MAEGHLQESPLYTRHFHFVKGRGTKRGTYSGRHGALKLTTGGRV